MARLPIASSPSGVGVMYEVRSGDNLTKIISEVHQMSHANPSAVIAQVLQDNPHITNANLIRPGNLIFIRKPDLQQNNLPDHIKEDIREAEASYSSLSQHERILLHTITPYISSTAITGLDHYDKAITKGNVHLNQIITDFENYKLDKLKKHQYDSFRVKNLDRWRATTGDLGKLATGNQPISKVFQAAKGRSKNPTAPMRAQVKSLSQMAKIANGSAIALKFIEPGLACHKLAHEPTSLQKNKVFWETAGGMAGGFAATAAVTSAKGLAIAAAIGIGPAGWGILVLVVSASALAGYAGSKAAAHAFDSKMQKYQVVELLRVDKICHTDHFPF